MSRRWLLLLASLPLGALLFVAAATGGPLDSTPPVIVPDVSPSPNGAGWNATDVSVSWTVNEPDSFVTSSSGCEPSLLSAETPGTTLTCEATSLGGTSSESVTIKIDKTAPTVAGSDPAPVEATGPATPVTLGATPSDNFDSDPVLSCIPPGPSYPRGITPVDCTATDDAGNTTSPAVAFNVTVTDITPPTLSGLTNQTLEATGTSGATATYSPTASDLVDGSVPVSCTPTSPETFAVGGPYTVECTAEDNATPNNVANGSFTVTVTDTDPDNPEFSPPPGNISVEANGPTGSVVFYGPVAASDPQDGAIVATCAPASGATFAIGMTPVSCTATDSNGNSGASGFTITVQDTTAPILILPGNLIIFSAGPVAASTLAITSLLSSASAIDLVDASPALTNNAPSSFPVGSTGVTFTAKDGAGNTTTATRFVNVVATPTPGAVLPTQPIPAEIQPDAPPGNVRAVAAKIGHRSIQLSWTNPADADFDHVEIMRTPGKRGTPQSLVYRGAAPKFRDDSLAAGQEYRYLLVSIDSKGNHAVGVALVVVARAQLLLAPKDEARVKAPPLLRWKAISTADYYNVQLFRGKTKLLSVWPLKPSYKLKARWRYGGKSFRLIPGIYTWFVWPGEGALAKADYGALLGEGHFTVIKKKGG